MMKGTVNGVEGVYHTTVVRNENYVTHKIFVPKERGTNYYMQNHKLVDYDLIK